MIDFVLNIFLFGGYIFLGIFCVLCVVIAILLIIVSIVLLALPIVDKMRDRHKKGRRWI